MTLIVRSWPTDQGDPGELLGTVVRALSQLESDGSCSVETDVIRGALDEEGLTVDCGSHRVGLRLVSGPGFYELAVVESWHSTR